MRRETSKVLLRRCTVIRAIMIGHEVETIAEEIVTRKQFSENKRELADKISLEFGFEYAP